MLSSPYGGLFALKCNGVVHEEQLPAFNLDFFFLSDSWTLRQLSHSEHRLTAGRVSLAWQTPPFRYSERASLNHFTESQSLTPVLPQ